ncbi:energy-coupling factor transporter transmembrane component T family protein [Microvirga antarctica]|uniref:energy-coupling factor transporter transmembrane component T family protein n=1 Tax=Microvirga antarctica TaxID=2819233 RepID=UPI001B3138B9|nr:energy-coupling factor transporter transmembrane component T [Microvirga antarctica]
MVRTLNPLSKVAVCAVWLVAAILIFDARFQIGAILIVCIVLVALERTSPLLLLGLMVPFSLFGLGFLTTALLFREDSAFALHVAGESVFGSPAASAGVTLFLRAVACGMISAFFALTTDPGAFVRGLMAHARLPPRFGYALFAALQLVPDLAAEAQQMRLARAMQSGRVLRRLPGPVEAGSLVIPLLAFAIRRAGRTAIAMEARGLDAHGPRTIMAVPPFEWRDAGFAAVAMIVLGGLIVLCANM